MADTPPQDQALDEHAKRRLKKFAKIMIGFFMGLFILAALFGEKKEKTDQVRRPYKPFYTHKTNVYAQNMVRDLNSALTQGFTHHAQVHKLDYAVEVLCEKATRFILAQVEVSQTDPSRATMEGLALFKFMDQYEPLLTKEGKSSYPRHKLSEGIATYCNGVLRHP